MTWTSLEGIESINITFGEGGAIAISICLAVIMFGVALKMELSQFKQVLSQPRGVVVGLISQWMLLPLVTMGLVFLLNPPASIALGMLLVSVCPGGNVSNFYSAHAGGSTALSVTLTSISTLLTSVLTPIIFVSMLGITDLGKELDIDISFWEMLKTLLLIVILPLIAGMLLYRYARSVADRLEKFFKILSFVILAGIIVVAFAGNAQAFLTYLLPILAIVVLHNTIAFAFAWYWARLTKCSIPESKSICIETGIQNSGLGLVLIFLFFDGNGGMACVAAFWGFWHLIGGFAASSIFKKKYPVPSLVEK